MCDSFVIMQDCSSSGKVIFAKNSDRPSFDCQPLAYHKAKKYAQGEKISLAYVTIPQANERYATLGSSPYWSWGYETGINEFGVTAGNEAIYTKDLTENSEAEKSGIHIEKGILGMELLRLGLERGKTAQEALTVMTRLIEKYGQWGSGVPMSGTIDGSYNNSYIVADKNEAYILETDGRRWVYKKVDSGFAAISNEVSIRTDYSCLSWDLEEYAKQKGWCDKKQTFDFAESYINHNYPRQLSHIRVQRMRQMLNRALSENGKIGNNWIKHILRDHYEDTFLEGPFFNPSAPDFLTICMHQSPAGFTWGNTASSCIIELPNSNCSIPIMWWAPCVPCCSLYIPVFVHSLGLPKAMEEAGTYGKNMCAPSDVNAEDAYKDGSLWWEMRSLLDLVNGDENGGKYKVRHTVVRAVFDDLEQKWGEEANEIIRKLDPNSAETARILYSFTEKCVGETTAAIKKLKNFISSI